MLISFGLGMHVQRWFDQRIIHIMDETINGCTEVMDRLQGKEPKRPEEWVYVDSPGSLA